MAHNAPISVRWTLGAYLRVCPKSLQKIASSRPNSAKAAV
jgi:hypothetical protein